MTAVVAFPKRTRIDGGIEPIRGPAQVIIFNGVRQERLHDNPNDIHIPMSRIRRPSRQNQAIAEELE